MLSVKTNIPKIKDKLKRIQLLIDGGWRKETVAILAAARDRVRLATPKSNKLTVQTTGKRDKRGRFLAGFGRKIGRGQHVRDGWTLKVIGADGKSRVPVFGVIYNRFTHRQNGDPLKSALLRTAGGSLKSYTLLEVLEFGSPSHVINASRAPYLVFKTRDGKWVKTKRVHHPGTAAHGMVRNTREWFYQRMRKHNDKWAIKVKMAWGQR